jgi:hypothetical protein
MKASRTDILRAVFSSNRVALWTDDGLRSVARMVGELGEAVASFSEPADAIWHGGPATDPALRIRHGDLAPWNTFWADGFPVFPEQRRRFGVWCDELAVDPAAVLSALRAVQAFERDRIAERGAAGIEPYAKFLARGDVAAIDAERAWLDAHHGALLAD